MQYHPIPEKIPLSSGVRAIDAAAAAETVTIGVDDLTEGEGEEEEEEEGEEGEAVGASTGDAFLPSVCDKVGYG